jgi:hypothetical protein
VRASTTTKRPNRSAITRALRASALFRAARQNQKSQKRKFFSPAPHQKPHFPKPRCAPRRFCAQRNGRGRGTHNHEQPAPSEMRSHELQPPPPCHGHPARVSDLRASEPHKLPTAITQNYPELPTFRTKYIPHPNSLRASFAPSRFRGLPPSPCPSLRHFPYLPISSHFLRNDQETSLPAPRIPARPRIRSEVAPFRR